MHQISKFDLYGTTSIPESKSRFIPKTGTFPLDFSIGSIKAGIKPDSSPQDDLVLVASEKPCIAAAVFTKNEFPAPSVKVSKEILRRSGGKGIRGIVANSGCANLFTGKDGMQDTVRMGEEAAAHLTDQEGSPSVMVMHTGAGGQRLPMDKITNTLPALRRKMDNSYQSWLSAAKGLLTTDTFPKMSSRTFVLPSSPHIKYSISGITKGAGMIHPNMATTLGILCTDASISATALQQLLSTAANKSYNCISIEGDTSTNDMVTMLANGAAGGNVIDFDPSLPSQSKDFVAMQKILIEFMAGLAKLVVRDGEGATKFITIRIRDAPSYPAGKKIAEAIARSVLFKTGIYGESPNWGCVAVSAGSSLMDTEFGGRGVVVEELMSVSLINRDENGEGIEEVVFLKNGVPVEVGEGRSEELMDKEDIEVLVRLRDDGTNGESEEEAVYWTCDLTHEFVTVNGDFRR